MRNWPLQDAKARFSELVDTCLRDGPQMVTRRGAETAVIVPVDEWRRIEQSTKKSLKELLLSDVARTDSLVGPRVRYATRNAVFED